MALSLSPTFWRVVSRIFGVVFIALGGLRLSLVPAHTAWYRSAIAESARAAAAGTPEICGLEVGGSESALRGDLLTVGLPLFLLGLGLLLARPRSIGTALILASTLTLVGALTCGVSPRLFLCFHGLSQLVWPGLLIALSIATHLPRLKRAAA
jgi:hypothetical protein